MTNTIVSSAYEINESSYVRPLFIGCSGGAGHNSAIEGIISYIKELYRNRLVMSHYEPVRWEDKDTSVGSLINQSMKVMHAAYAGAAVQQLLHLTPIPVLPKKEQCDEEIRQLFSKQQKLKIREYVDMMLDVYPEGYKSVAIWNVTQRDDKASELKKLVALQSRSDEQNYPVVYNYFFNRLKSASESGQPYTELISTQAMALPALCDAVKDYNEWALKQKGIPQVVIHQYMTDLPSPGAVHFFNPLSSLTAKQQKQMKLYGLGMNKEIIEHFFPADTNFSGIYDIPASGNPMVRAGFKDLRLDNSTRFEERITLQLNDEYEYIIDDNERIASIMLGSQAGNDSFEYIEVLLKNGIDRVFVFGGKTNATLKAKIEKFLEENAEYRGRIIPLSNQDDKTMTPLMTRSNVLVLRGGGLSVMEQLAMRHNPGQQIFIHHANSSEQEPSSGISWEDDNVRVLMRELEQKGISCKKTTPNRFEHDLIETQIASRLGKPSHALSELSLDSLHYVQYLMANEAFLRRQYGDIQQCLNEYLLPLNGLIRSLQVQELHLESETNPTVSKQVYRHKLAVIHEAILCLKTCMFPKSEDHGVLNAIRLRKLLMKAMRNNYLYVHTSGAEYSQTEILVNSVIAQLDSFIIQFQNVSEKPRHASVVNSGIFSNKLTLKLSPMEKASLLAELKASCPSLEGPTDPRKRANQNMYKMAEQYLNDPSLYFFNELLRLKKIFSELNRCAYNFLASGTHLIDQILSLEKYSLKKKEKWTLINDTQEIKKTAQEDLPEFEGFVLVT